MRTIPLVALAATAALATTAAAEIIVIEVDLSFADEVPAPVVTGFSPTGSATVTINTDTLFVEIMGTYSGMTSNVNNAHLHGLAAPGAIASPIFTLAHDGGTSGTISGSATLSAGNFQGLLDGLTYINVHTVNNASGEIRGQVIVPTPGSMALMGLAGLTAMRRRR